MKKIIALALNLIFCSLTFAQDMPGMKMPKKENKKTSVKTTSSGEHIIYTCVMHPQIKVSKPGNCPICGMKLVKKVVKSVPSKNAEMKMEGDMKMDKTDTMKMNDDMSKMKMGNTANTMKMNDMGKMKMDKGDTMKMLMGGGNEPMDMGSMSDPFSLHLPMERHGSGTAWLPDASPMHGYMHHTSNWMFMLHGNIFLRYTKQDIDNKGSRGGIKYDAPNWLMFMGQSKVGGKGLFHFSTMFSLDPVTEGGQGYPLLFQSGEAYNGRPIVDRQHPHDLFSELSVSYSHAFSKEADAFIYVGYPGEPALGPVAFMHRPAALYNPDAPISHHWSDATHITFGEFKIEGSSFTGREPDDKRFNFDKPKFDSWSGRLSFNPSANWALQVSHGFIKSPEALHPDEDVNRTTASAIYSMSLKNKGWINVSGVYGVNKSKDHKAENSFLLEASWNKKRLAFYSRYEFVQKSVEELALDENIYGHDVVFPVNAFTLGVNYDVIQLANTRLSLGTQFTYNHADEKLNSLYGKNPMAFEVYLRIYPALMQMK
jgi:hypothetical protein